MADSKTAIRQEMRRQRRALSQAVRSAAEVAVADAVRALPAYAAAPLLLAYVATDNEVPTGALIAAAHADGKRVYLPRLGDGTMSFAEHRLGVALRSGAYAIPEPTGDSLPASRIAAALAVIPLLAWDEAGGRVGRGGGHYDAAFAAPTRPDTVVGLGYAFQQHPRLPRDPWDLRLDLVVTEDGAHVCWTGDFESPSTKEVANDDGLHDDPSGQPRAGRRSGLPHRPASPPAG